MILEGELDLSCCEDLNREIAKLEARHLDRFVIDLSELQFIDSTGVACFVHLMQRNRESQTTIRFLRGPAPVARLFEIAGLEELLPFEG